MESPYLSKKVRVKGIRKETQNTNTYTLEPVEEPNSSLLFEAGQFVMLDIMGLGESAFTISSYPGGTSCFELTIRNVGQVTSAVHRLKVGDHVGVRGPYGNGWPLKQVVEKSLLIISGGSGCAPLRPVILKHKSEQNVFLNLEILYGARTPGDVLYKKEFMEWGNLPRTRLHLTVDAVPPNVIWEHNVGVVTKLFDSIETSPDDSLVFICGPEIMMKFSVLGLLNLGFSEDQLFLSMERRMRCGVGLCGHCQIGPKYVCRDGPVFQYSELKGLPDHIV
jgi:NAD(P)H-flavin reductase